MLDVFKLSVLAVGASKVPSIKTPALRLIHLLKSHRPIKTWAPLVICNICSIWQCELGRPADLLKFVSTEGCPPSLFSSSSSSYLQDLVGLFPFRNHLLALRNSKGPRRIHLQKCQPASFAQAPLKYTWISASSVHTLMGWSAVDLLGAHKEGCLHLVCNSWSWGPIVVFLPSSSDNQHEDSVKFVVEKNHNSHGLSAHMLTAYQSPALHAWTMLHDHLVDFSPVHVCCWCLHFSELLAGIWSPSKTLKPLHLFHHSIAAPSLLLHLSRSDCLPDIGAKVIDLLSSPLGSQSRSKWETLHQTTAASSDAGPVAVSATLLNTTFSGILSGSNSSLLGSRCLDISPEWH